MSVSAIFSVPQQHYLSPFIPVGHNYYYIVFVSFVCCLGFFFLRFRLIDTQQAVTRLLFWITA